MCRAASMSGIWALRSQCDMRTESSVSPQRKQRPNRLERGCFAEIVRSNEQVEQPQVFHLEVAESPEIFNADVLEHCRFLSWLSNHSIQTFAPQFDMRYHLSPP